jgi:hypothetical protein
MLGPNLARTATIFICFFIFVCLFWWFWCLNSGPLGSLCWPVFYISLETGNILLKKLETMKESSSLGRKNSKKPNCKEVLWGAKIPSQLVAEFNYCIDIASSNLLPFLHPMHWLCQSLIQPSVLPNCPCVLMLFSQPVTTDHKRQSRACHVTLCSWAPSSPA